MKTFIPGWAFGLLLLLSFSSPAQQLQRLEGRVRDSSGAPVADAAISCEGGGETRSDASGRFSLSCSGRVAIVTAVFNGLQTSEQVSSGARIDLILRPAAVRDSAVVTTTRSPSSLSGVTGTVDILDRTKLTQYPALTLDERLRQHAGFELFRRSSSWVANPTSEGISLRGLGSTAASRTLVLSDLVPLNDGFGGWIHWNEIPSEAIEAVTLASGGGSDLYGSSALGGVIDIVPSRPGPLLGEAELAAASEDTSTYSARTDAQQGRWSELLAAQDFRTAGYTVIAPAVRGLVDVPSNVHYQTGRVEVDRALPKDNRLWLTGNLLNEARGNGTLLQTNATRLWRYVGGDDWSAGSSASGRIRSFGSDEAYRQSFSAIDAARSSEKLTRRQHVGTQEFGASTDLSLHLTHIALVGGGDLRDLRSTDFEIPYSAAAPSGLQDTTARQRFIGGFGEMLGERGAWAGAASLRADEAANLATGTVSLAISNTGVESVTSTPVTDRHELVFSPRLGLSRRLRENTRIHASAFRAFRTPTMNELYRTGQVGQQVTRPNADLLSERATGAEGGADWTAPRELLAFQATYFWTEINRPVSAVLLSGNTYNRENLGQIQSQGIALNVQLHETGGFSADFGYQYAHSIVTAFHSTPSLVGLWIPSVPRHSATAQAYYRRGAATCMLAARASGRAFDDSSNAYELHSFFVLDAYADYRVHRHMSLYLSFQNLLNRDIETARTPSLTLGTPFVAQGGIRLDWRRN